MTSLSHSLVLTCLIFLFSSHFVLSYWHSPFPSSLYTVTLPRILPPSHPVALPRTLPPSLAITRTLPPSLAITRTLPPSLPPSLSLPRTSLLPDPSVQEVTHKYTPSGGCNTRLHLNAFPLSVLLPFHHSSPDSLTAYLYFYIPFSFILFLLHSLTSAPLLVRYSPCS